MICDLCCQNDASIHIDEVINGFKKSINMCEPCARKKNLKLQSITGSWFSDTINSISLPKIIELEENQRCPLVCSNCKLTLEEFRKTGKLGCPACYCEFGNVIREILPVIHNGEVHNGRHPDLTRNCDNNEPKVAASKIVDNAEGHITTLEKILEDAVATEDFELAAVLRDQIGTIQDQTNKLSVTDSKK